MSDFNAYWDAWAPVWEHIENMFFEVDSLKSILDKVQSPVLVVGAGQGLVVEELIKQGFDCDGLDLSPQMVAMAQRKRGLKLIQGNACDMPCSGNFYRACISASGVIDFIEDEEMIAQIIGEMQRVTADTGKVFIAFYHFSDELEKLCRDIGLIKDGRFYVRNSLRNAADMASMELPELQQQPPIGNEKEQRAGLGYYRVFKDAKDTEALIRVAPETQCYRTEDEVRALFQRLGIEIREVRDSGTSYIVEIPAGCERIRAFPDT